MKNRYFYEFSGRVYVEADHQDQAEELVTGIHLDDYLIEEELYAIDENYVSPDLETRQKQFGTIHHPLNEADGFENYEIRNSIYGPIFRDFLNGKIDKQELVEKMDQAEHNNDLLEDCNLFAQLDMVDLETKKTKKIRLVAVD